MIPLKETSVEDFERHALAILQRELGLDGLARFHLDPFRQSRWAPYGGAGISGRFDRVSGARAYLLVVAGLDGPIRNGMTPSVELGLGGGARLGVILRRATGERR